ncbi:MAG: hypothetical protein ACKV0T_06250 [Planctomycetales bacterium]
MKNIGRAQLGLLRGFDFGPVNLVCVVALAVTLAPATTRAGVVFDGSATKDKSKTDEDFFCRWTSTLNPEPAILYVGQDAKLNSAIIGAIDQAGFNATNGWTVTYKNLNGLFTLSEYYAWVTQQPQITAGGIPSKGHDHGQIGGAAFVLGFDRGVGDPMPQDTHWMQVVQTNAPGERGFNSGGGFVSQVDNQKSTTDPTFDGNGGAANAYVFIDVPHDFCPFGCDYHASWRFVTFIVTRDVNNKSLEIYRKGVEWGYDFSCQPKEIAGVPEPCMLVMLSILIGIFCVGRRAPEADCDSLNRPERERGQVH